MNEKSKLFPEITTSNLLREKLTLPESFLGELNLLLIPFLQWQQRSVDTWLPYAQEMERGHSGLYYYELPTIKKMNWLSKLSINEGMRAGIPDLQARERTITLYVDKEKFKKDLSIESEKVITILLIDRQGSVLWRTTGDFSFEKTVQLKNILGSYTEFSPESQIEAGVLL